MAINLDLNKEVFKPTKKAERGEDRAARLLERVLAERDKSDQFEKKADVKADVKPDVKADVKPDVKADVKPDVKADVKPDVKADVKPDVKADVINVVNSLKQKNNILFLSDTIEYSLLNESQLKVLGEICKLCILSSKLSTGKTTYEFIAEKSQINIATIKGIVRKLESCNILLKKDHQYTSGSKGRSFEISEKTLLCMLSQNRNLIRWLARNGLRVNDIKKIYDFR